MLIRLDISQICRPVAVHALAFTNSVKAASSQHLGPGRSRSAPPLLRTACLNLMQPYLRLPLPEQELHTLLQELWVRDELEGHSGAVPGAEHALGMVHVDDAHRLSDSLVRDVNDDAVSTVYWITV